MSDEKKSLRGSREESQFLAVIRVWAALAWADGVLDAKEEEAMRRLVAGAELDEEERSAALGFLDNKVDLELANLAGLNDRAREGIYRAALRLARVDQRVSPEERALLARLRDGLEIDLHLAERLEAALRSV
jgi:uncharacterized membrane protein YebE (DUF533 family)